jgi:hypothetical protein
MTFETKQKIRFFAFFVAIFIDSKKKEKKIKLNNLRWHVRALKQNMFQTPLLS